MANLRGAALLCVALVACGSSDDEESTPSPSSIDEPATTVAASSTPATEPGTAAAAPADPRAVLDEILGWMADPATVDPTRFSDEFLALVPAAEIVEGLESLGVGTWEASAVEGDEHGLIARLTGPGETQLVELALDDAGDIAGLQFQPAELSDPPTTLSGLTDRLAASAETTGVLIAEVAADGTCEPVAALAPDDPISLGSTFKLYVLGAVTTAIADGTVSWDQAVPIRDELDSLPSGTTQDEPPGTSLPVRELALRMIAMSDNTATDHLIDLVGRDAVEAALGDLGHDDPAVTMPFPTTRELFIVKADLDLLGRYEAADEAGRRDLLEGEVAAAPLPGIDAMWTEPPRRRHRRVVRLTRRHLPGPRRAVRPCRHPRPRADRARSCRPIPAPGSTRRSSPACCSRAAPSRASCSPPGWRPARTVRGSSSPAARPIPRRSSTRRSSNCSPSGSR